MMRRAAPAAAILALCFATACSSGMTTIGPLTMDVPEGWLVTDREGNNLKLTDGTIADATATRAGTATAVFDIYVDSDQTPQAFIDYLDEQDIKPERDRTRVGGFDAEIFRYTGRAVGGRQEAVIVPDKRVFILYRAAFRDDDAAFLRGRAAFRRAVRSITFSSGGSSSGRPNSASTGTRHGPTFGNNASTAIAAPVAIITKAS